MGRGEEVQRDVGREDLLWEGGLEQGRETFLEDAQSFAQLRFAIIWWFVGSLAQRWRGVCIGEGRAEPHFWQVPSVGFLEGGKGF